MTYVKTGQRYKSTNEPAQSELEKKRSGELGGLVPHTSNTPGKELSNWSGNQRIPLANNE